MGTVETSPRPKIRPTKRPKIRPSEKEIADKRIGRIIERSNEIKKQIDIEAEGLLDRTPLVPIKEPTGDPVREFTLGGDVRHNPNRGKTY
tara:strand:- start:2648 stop:2917 length:270 start_codon:yes stop_codon:yes gene_type:complete